MIPCRNASVNIIQRSPIFTKAFTFSYKVLPLPDYSNLSSYQRRCIPFIPLTTKCNSCFLNFIQENIFSNLIKLHEVFFLYYQNLKISSRIIYSRNFETTSRIFNEREIM